MIFKSILVSLVVAAIGSGLLYVMQVVEPNHLLANAVALFIAGSISAYITNLIASPTNSAVSSSNTSSDNNSSSTQLSGDEDREEGEVKWFNVSKGFGFITRQSGDDIFVHYRSIRGEGHRSLSEGQKVDYVVVDGDKGFQAEDVVAISPPTRRARK